MLYKARWIDFYYFISDQNVKHSLNQYNKGPTIALGSAACATISSCHYKEHNITTSTGESNTFFDTWWKIQTWFSKIGSL